MKKITIFLLTLLHFAYAFNLAGFEWGLNFLKPSDNRFNAYSTSFSLVVPISDKLKIGYLSENININGQDNTATASGTISVSALRFNLDVLKDQQKLPVDVSILLDIGGADISVGSLQNSKPMGDIGIRVYKENYKSNIFSYQLSMQVFYRFLRPDADATQVFGIGTNPVKDLGGFGLGFNVMMAY